MATMQSFEIMSRGLIIVLPENAHKTETLRCINI